MQLYIKFVPNKAKTLIIANKIGMTESDLILLSKYQNELLNNQFINRNISKF